jgi:hypothetical protein
MDDVLTNEQFCARFKAEMLRRASPHNTFEDCQSIADYADKVAPTYWDEAMWREEGPEECAAADMSYWGE